MCVSLFASFLPSFKQTDKHTHTHTDCGRFNETSFQMNTKNTVTWSHKVCVCVCVYVLEALTGGLIG